MKVNKLIRFSIENEDIIKPTEQDIEDMQFTKVHFRFYSNQLNAHGYICDLDTLKKYAPTISGKPILAYINNMANNGDGDFAGHENGTIFKEFPIGFFPTKGLNITYEVGDDGTVYSCADGYIWNVYYQDAVDIFTQSNGKKGVSSEVFIIESEIIDDNVEKILQMSFTGVTVLGSQNANFIPIQPAVKGCEGKLVGFAEINDKFVDAKSRFEQVLYSKIDESSCDGSFLMQKNKEENMAKKSEEKKATASSEVVENAEKVVTTEVEVSTYTENYDDDGCYVGSEEEKHKSRKTEFIETDQEKSSEKNSHEENFSEDEKHEKNTCTDVDNACDKKQENAEDSFEKESDSKGDKSEDKENEKKDVVDNSEELNAALQKCSALEDELSKLKIKCAELEEYKTNKEMESVRHTIEIALNGVSDVLSSKQIAELREKSKKCSVNTVDGFINEIKAFAFDIQSKNGAKKRDTIRCSVVSNSLDSDETEPIDLWDRISKKYEKQ